MIRQAKWKWMGLVLAGVLAFTVPAQAASLPPAASQSWAAPDLALMVDTGILNLDASFDPTAPASRGEAIKEILLASGQDANWQALNSGPLIYQDVPAGSSFYPYTLLATELQIVDGYPGHIFQPHRSVVRDEMAKILTLTITRVDPSQESEFQHLQGQPALVSKLLSRFNDADSIPGWSRPYVAFVVEQGLFFGFPDGYFYPRRKMDEAQLATLAGRLMRAVNDPYDVHGQLVSSDSQSLTVASGGQQQTLSTAPNVNVFRNQQPVAVQDLAPGDDVNVILNQQQQVVYASASLNDLLGVVTSVHGSAANNVQLTIQPLDGGAPKKVLVDPSTQVNYDGQPAAARTLATGDRAYVVLASDGQTAQTIQAAGFTFSGRVLIVSPDSQVITVTTGSGPLTMDLSASTVVIENGQRVDSPVVSNGDQVLVAVPGVKSLSDVDFSQPVEPVYIEVYSR